MICAGLPPAEEIRCLDDLNLKVNAEIGKIVRAGKSCPFPTDDKSDETGAADCDCYATEKVRLLKNQGYQARTRVVYIPKRGEWHRIAEVNGRYLDNLSPWTYSQNRSYIFIGQ